MCWCSDYCYCDSFFFINLPDSKITANTVNTEPSTTNNQLENSSIIKNIGENLNEIKIGVTSLISAPEIQPEQPKDYCGDGFCTSVEDCSTCASDCGECSEVKVVCGDKVCNFGECSSCPSDCPIIQCGNSVCESSKGENCLTAPDDCRCAQNEVCNQATAKCETSTTPTNQFQQPQIPSESPDENYPILFIHGHSFTNQETSGASLNAFQPIERKLSDENYVEKGTNIFPGDNINNFKAGIFSNREKPVTFKTTYYTGVFSLEGIYIEDQDSKSISVYGSRIQNVVNIILKLTGKKKVNIVAHSMGGLVAREYIEHDGGDKYVNKLIMIGTPNHGIWRSDLTVNVLLTLGNGCGIGHPGLECDDMHHDSLFLQSLNQQETVNGVKIYTIEGYCGNSDMGELWDNVVRASSVQINGAENFPVYCKDQSKYSLTNSFHNAMLKPDEVPEVYKKVVDILRQ